MKKTKETMVFPSLHLTGLNGQTAAWVRRLWGKPLAGPSLALDGGKRSRDRRSNMSGEGSSLYHLPSLHKDSITIIPPPNRPMIGNFRRPNGWGDQLGGGYPLKMDADVLRSRTYLPLAFPNPISRSSNLLIFSKRCFNVVLRHHSC